MATKAEVNLWPNIRNFIPIAIFFLVLQGRAGFAVSESDGLKLYKVDVPASVEGMLLEAISLEGMGRYHDAVLVLEEVFAIEKRRLLRNKYDYKDKFKLYPLSKVPRLKAIAFFLAGRAYYNIGQYSKSISYFKMVPGESDLGGKARVFENWCYFKLSRFDLIKKNASSAEFVGPLRHWEVPKAMI